MLNEERTLEIHGTVVSRLPPGSNKRVVMVCEGCGQQRSVQFNKRRRYCRSCAAKRKPPRLPITDETRCKMCVAQSNRSDETRRKMGDAQRGKTISEETREKLSEIRKRENLSEDTLRKKSERRHSEQTRRRMSATRQGIQYDEWESFARDMSYCPNFNNACRESNRDKYARRCFLCDKPEEENGRRLSVHHVDMNKNQGCDGHAWKLVPLCSHHHASSSHTEVWAARIQYLLNHVWEGFNVE